MGSGAAEMAGVAGMEPNDLRIRIVHRLPFLCLPAVRQVVSSSTAHHPATRRGRLYPIAPTRVANSLPMAIRLAAELEGPMAGLLAR